LLDGARRYGGRDARAGGLPEKPELSRRSRRQGDAGASAPMSERLAVRIAGKQSGARDICVLELESLDGEPLPAYAPGAHVDVHVGNGISRQYSLCRYGGPAARYQIAVLREPASRGGSRAVHDVLDV